MTFFCLVCALPAILGDDGGTFKSFMSNKEDHPPNRVDPIGL